MKKYYKVLSHIALWSILFVFIVITLLIAAFFYYSRYLPDPNAWQERKVIQSTKIYDRENKTLLYEIHGEEKRTIVAYSDISQIVKNATIVAEDAEFYNHSGINFRGILRAILADIRDKKILEGGSSITQQLIKNAYLSPERTLSRKIKELILAITLEKKYSKDQIVTGTVERVTPYGVFVTLGDGLEGMVHISKIPPNETLEVGKSLECMIESIDTAVRKISLVPVSREKPILYR